MPNTIETRSHVVKVETSRDGSTIFLTCTACDFYHDMETRHPYFGSVAQYAEEHELLAPVVIGGK